MIDKTAKQNNFATPFIVGGFPRDIILKNFDNIKDVDLTCGNEDSSSLGEALVKLLPGSTFTIYNDGHGKLHFEDYDLDFSNNFKIKGIDQFLKAAGINNATEMQKELYSRDFTINTLLMPLNLSTVYDLIGLGIEHINKKIIDTCLSPRFTFMSDPKRIIRVVYLGAKLGFMPSERVSTWIRNHPEMLKSAPEGYIKDKLNSALKKNKEFAIQLIKQLNLENQIPFTQDVIESITTGKNE